MSLPSHNGKPEEEMFFNQPPARHSPTIEPLRINKRASTASPSPSISSQHNLALPASTTASSVAYPAPSLPYPDGPPKPQPPCATKASPAPYPYPDPRRVASPEYGRIASPSSVAGPPPTISANSALQNATDYPAALPSHEARHSRQMPSLTERRGTGPKPLPDSPGPEIPDKDDLFQKPVQRDRPTGAEVPPATAKGSRQDVNPYPDYHQQYWPPPGADSPAPSNRLNVRDQSSINRISSTASTSTTKAQRGSPPPPETPIIPLGHRPSTDIEARYAAAGIAGTSTLTSLQAQNAAAQQRAASYANLNPRPQAAEPGPRRPWTPTEQPGSTPHGVSTVYQGPGEAEETPSASAASPPRQPGSSNAYQGPGRVPPNALENDVARLHVTDEPPPAYSQTPGGPGHTTYPSEKGRLNTNVEGGLGAATAAGVTAATAQHPSQQNHPAFANDVRQQQQPSPGPVRRQSRNGVISPQQANYPANLSAATLNPPPASPPPLPEGWIAHMDPNSGQYYYIHLPTQSTQWEFPKGPTPLNLNETPLSPVASQFNNPLASPGLSFASKPLASPGLPMTPGFGEHSMSLGGSLSGQAGFTGPPPSAGVDLYRVNATNGVYFGPYLRYTNMDIEHGLWLGSILLITDAPQPPTIHIHQSVDLSPNPRQLKAMNIASHQRWTFYKYEIDLRMEDAGAAKWTYAITSHLGCTRYEFLVAGRHETNWRFVATSCNDFSLSVSANERSRLGGVGFMWKDIMQKHVECGGFHCQLGLGSQIYADRIWKEIPSLKQWLAMSGKETRKNAVWTAAHEEDVSHAYFHYYTSHFDQPHLREAFAQIPHVLSIDDHDM